MNKPQRASLVKSLAASLLISACAAPLPARDRPCGDCNDDGVTNVLDVLLAAEHTAGLVQLGPLDFEACNVVGTYGGLHVPGAVVDVSDALEIARSSGGLTQLACIFNTPLVYQSESWPAAREQIFKQDLKSGQITQVTTSDPYGVHRGPDVSPDGTEIAFFYIASMPGSRPSIAVIGMNGRNFRIVYTSTGGIIPDPSWSPDGQQIAFWGAPAGGMRNPDIWRVNRNGTGLTNITNTPDYWDQRPDWSVNDQIAFETNKDYLLSGLSVSGDTATIHRIDPNGANEFAITHPSVVPGTPRGDHWPKWSPDGENLVFCSTLHGRLRPAVPSGSSALFDLYVVNRDGLNPQKITATSSLSEELPAVSRDGKSLFYNLDFFGGGDYDIFKIDISTRQVSPVTPWGVRSEVHPSQ